MLPERWGKSVSASESRKSTRLLTLRTGKITGPAESEQIDCAVLNVSGSGACILVPADVTIAEFFQLSIDCEDAIRQCRRVWRDGSRVGIAFIAGRADVIRGDARPH
jgi:hypothetical protein